ncbi:MAG: hypothetical protein O3C27_00555 [Actinomycetota bacterium]|nr:hypothetical protein [Actinomycetota bacterium]
MFEANSWSPGRRRAVIGSLALLFVAVNTTVFALARGSDRQSINASGTRVEVRGTTTVPGSTTFTTIALQTLATTVTLVPSVEGDGDTVLSTPVTETQPPTTVRSTSTTRTTTTTTAASTAPPPPTTLSRTTSTTSTTVTTGEDV